MFKYTMVMVLALSVTLAGRAESTKDFGDHLPYEFGETVHGFQDDFSGGLSGDWQWVSQSGRANPFSMATLADGTPEGRSVLQHTGSVGIDNNHLLYMPSVDYSSTTGAQEVLMRLQVTSLTGYGSNNVYGGAAVAVNPDTSAGVDLHIIKFLANPNTSAQRFRVGIGSNLDGGRLESQWTLGSWYWLRLIYDADTDKVYAKAWLSGTEEPGWDRDGVVYTSLGYTGMTGWAGISANSSGNITFNVDYFLVKAEGLPDITVGDFGSIPEPATMSLLALGGLALLRRR